MPSEAQPQRPGPPPTPSRCPVLRRRPYGRPSTRARRRQRVTTASAPRSAGTQARTEQRPRRRATTARRGVPSTATPHHVQRRSAGPRPPGGGAASVPTTARPRRGPPPASVNGDGDQRRRGPPGPGGAPSAADQATSRLTPTPEIGSATRRRSPQGEDPDAHQGEPAPRQHRTQRGGHPGHTAATARLHLRLRAGRSSLRVPSSFPGGTRRCSTTRRGETNDHRE